MPRFYIKKLSIFGENKTPSYVEFGNGLNIVYGVSDTGKTCIVNCIDFVFGSKNNTPIPESHGYSSIQLLIETENGAVTLERKIGTNKIKVISANPAVLSGDYPHYSSNGGDIGTVLLGLIGITDNPEVIKNKLYEKVRLTWRTFMHSFLIKEEEVFQTPSILISKESTAVTSSISGLLYLIAAIDFSKVTPGEDKKIREARKRAVETYINEELFSLGEKKLNLDKLLAAVDPSSAENAIQRLVDELTAVEARIANEVAKSRGTLSKIIGERDHLAECDLLISRYSELRSQYAADIKRLSFIVDGQTNFEAVPSIEKCPFCDGALTECSHPSYIEAANAELARIVNQLNDLVEIEKSILADRAVIVATLASLSSERTGAETLIKNELQPKAQTLKNTLRDYRAVVRIQNEIDLVEELKKEKTEKLIAMLAASEESALEYKPREHFPNGFEKTITDLYVATLKACKYENLVGGQFSLQSFDVIVNAKKKANYGKGYRAFLNVTLAITMREYLCRYGKFAPRLLIVDSPLLSLEQGVSESAPESMKADLIEYLIKTQTIGQTIIVENKIPNLDYAAGNVTLLNFTKGKADGRYGLLADVHD